MTTGVTYASLRSLENTAQLSVCAGRSVYVKLTWASSRRGRPRELRFGQTSRSGRICGVLTRNDGGGRSDLAFSVSSASIEQEWNTYVHSWDGIA